MKELAITRVALVTCRDLPDLTPDDRLLVPELQQRGVEAVPVLWDDEGVAWEAFDAVVVRSCWDYYHHAGRFLAWLGRLETCGARVFNPVPVLRENAHKSYLLRLEQAGVPIVPTAYLPRGARTSLAGLLAERGWPQAVVKPAISAGAHETWVVAEREAPGKQAALEALAAAGDVLVQSFLPAIATDGEWSLMFFGGAYSHAVLKQPRAGEFRVQKEHGGTTRAAVPAAALREECRRLLQHVPGSWLYARVDGLDLNGTFTLMELELIEPELFFLNDPLAAGRFVDALLAACSAAGRHPDD